MAGAAVGAQTITITGTSTTDPTIHSDTTLTVNVAGGAGGHCLIATATYGSELSPEVQFLRNFRDNWILRTRSGSAFMVAFNAWYYSFSPTVAQFIGEHSTVRTAAKFMLYPLMGILTIGAAAFHLYPTNLEVGALTSGLVVSALIGAVYLAPPLAVAFAYSSRLRRTARKLQLPSALVLFGAVAALALLIMTGGSGVLTMVATSTIVLATLTLSALCASDAILHVAKPV